ncbi:MAG: GGDEF domain-containing phosphodiesterase [Lachnospiraceae bacterium]|nr:GGDEF domain-containing phosphodiesterase [Lachnospiraceae bacterium]
MVDLHDYSVAMDEFILRMERLNIWNVDAMSQIITPICRALRIARVQVESFNTIKDEKEHRGDIDIYFDEGIPNPNNPYKVREESGGHSVVVITIYERQDAEPWKAEDLEKIHVFQKAFYAFTGRIRLLDLIDIRTSMDMQLMVYNLSYVMELIGRMAAQRRAQEFGYCYFNMKSFSLVNERVGRDKATNLMKDYVHQLAEKLRDPGTIGRIGGDNFLILFDRKDLEIVRSHMHGVSFVYNEDTGERINISAAAGYFLPDERDEILGPESVMDRVGVAMMAAKKSKDTDEVFYSEEMERRQTEVKRIENRFPEAIRNGEFKVYYQPKVDLHDYHLTGAEALCRWVIDGEVIPPGKFIPILEQSNNICTLDFYMLERVCHDVRRWLDAGKEPVRISFNLSRRHLGDMDLLKHILEIIDGNHVPHEYIEVELTETTTDVEFNDLKKIVNGLQEAGIATSVDDFGTGYSSINLLREVPWNVLKLDKSFLPTAEDDKNYDSTMLRHVIAMAQDMGLECIMEGVETEDHVWLLQDSNCFMAQGFFFDKPMPVMEFEERLARKNESFWPKND